eukprot:CAMPEP_0114164174 /NCGR_PEP_ID=MMETSP0043_2-20121206/30494_1 /TAXON_ID=464988 /ORGANISM="Hemiselmis andersenii, Strain CCMP644" /LENGTH=210 /DNA_ID=CAMNT_0001260751 /DNA_START=30 /DNA_END=662 /DNA_ORIENTATION=+
MKEQMLDGHLPAGPSSPLSDGGRDELSPAKRHALPFLGQVGRRHTESSLAHPQSSAATRDDLSGGDDVPGGPGWHSPKYRGRRVSRPMSDLGGVLRVPGEDSSMGKRVKRSVRWMDEGAGGSGSSSLGSVDGTYSFDGLGLTRPSGRQLRGRTLGSGWGDALKKLMRFVSISGSGAPPSSPIRGSSPKHGRCALRAPAAANGKILLAVVR